MKSTIVSLMGLIMFMGMVQVQASDIDLGISVTDGKLRNFYLAIGDYYQVPPRQIVQIHERCRCTDEELPVIYFLAARARVEPGAIIDLRIGGMSWFEIALHYRLGPDIFFIPVTATRIGPPYGKAYGYYRKYGSGGNWQKTKLSDSDVTALVNLRFMSEHYRMTPEKVMEMRNREKRFMVINDEIGKEKDKGKPEKQAETKKNQSGKDKR